MKRKIKTKDRQLLDIVDDEIEYMYEDTSKLYILTKADINFIHWMFECWSKEKMVSEQNPNNPQDEPYRCLPIFKALFFNGWYFSGDRRRTSSEAARATFRKDYEGV